MSDVKLIWLKIGLILNDDTNSVTGKFSYTLKIQKYEKWWPRNLETFETIQNSII